jgi:hypothetical protein
VKLGRPNVFTSFAQTFSEPNIGPFPQFNIEIEDVPIDQEMPSSAPTRRYRSLLKSALVKLLESSTNDLIRLQTVVDNPRSRKATHVRWAPVISSLFQDHEQYIEENPPPFQQIIIHPESFVPEGGNAPLTPSALSRTQILNLNATVDSLQLNALMVQEVAMMKALAALVK